ncbi:Uncharacterised protein [Mycobacteroides abscessus subsp. abscessus]|nr:Uncharacterised protein [Mycobacteroides abscessus subsp. abscessus]
MARRIDSATRGRCVEFCMLFGPLFRSDKATNVAAALLHGISEESVRRMRKGNPGKYGIQPPLPGLGDDLL